jgi:hypothetical protein
MRLGVLLAGLIVAFATAAPVGAQQRAPDLPPDMWAPAASPEAHAAASSSGGLPLAVALAALAVVAVAGFLVGDRMPALRRGARVETCWIALWRSGTRAEFRAVVGHGAGRVVVGRSPIFTVPTTGAIPDDGAARDAHEALIDHLRSLAWEPAATDGDAWYHLSFEQRPAEDRLAVPT